MREKQKKPLITFEQSQNMSIKSLTSCLDSLEVRTQEIIMLMSQFL